MPRPVCQLARAPVVPYVPTVRSGRFEDPVAAVRAILGGALALATFILVGMWLSSGHFDWQWGRFVGLLWIFWAVFHDTLNLVVRPLMQIFTGAALGDSPAPTFTIEEETALLERLLESPTADRHRKVLTAIRLAEIYRTHERDHAKADRLLAETRAHYPDARELDGTLPRS